jgi:hypothetical protein
MAEILDIYRVVKITNKQAKKLEKANRKSQDWIYKIGGYPIGTPGTSIVKRAFKRRYPWIKDRRKHLAFSKAFDGKFIHEAQKQEGTIKMSVIQIDNRGWSILNRTFFYMLPKGLLREWAKANSEMNNLTVSFFGGIIIGGVVAIAAVLTLIK